MSKVPKVILLIEKSRAFGRELAGMGAASRKRYLYVVERLIKHYWRSPAELTEQQVL